MSVTINPINLNIQITRGDSFSFTIRDKPTGSPFVFGLNDTITMTVRRNVGDAEAVFQKEFNPDVNGNIIITIDPEDTKEEEFGTCVYDVQWSKADGSIYTIIPKSGNTSSIPIFEICKEVT